jgi:virulence factor Mce-like protein
VNRRTALLAMAAAAVLAVVAVIGWRVTRPAPTTITAYFDRAVGLYAGSDVRVLGVKVGTVDRVTPQGPVVRVDLSVSPDYPIPPDPSAAVVAPSLVSDRYVQLTPAYVDGPTLASGAVIPRERTATPVEIDELLHSLDTLARQLGPDGANRTGALSAVLDTTAANLNGNGADLNTTLTQLGALADTLNHSRGDLFATVDNLNTFTATLVKHDAEVRNLQGRLAEVAGFLGDERGQVGQSLASLADALGKVNHFVKDNRELLATNLDQLTSTTQALVNRKQQLGQLVDTSATGLSNYLASYDQASRSIAVRGEFPETQLGPATLVCTILQHYSPPLFQQLTQACVSGAGGVEKGLGIPPISTIGGDLQAGKPPLRSPGGN